MSISLPNGTLLAAPSAQTQYTAAVTRILHLSSFPPELKTRDLQVMFRDYESDKGGFRIKWVDDVNALVVFADAGVAKRAYLTFLLSPPPAFPPPAKIRPYDRPDAAQIIQILSARSMGHRSSMSQAQSQHQPSLSQSSVLEGLPGTHSRAMSMSTAGAGGGGMGSFAFPKGGRASVSGGIAGHGTHGSIGGNGNGGLPGLASRTNGSHGRTGSSSFSQRSGSGFGALNFGNGSSSISTGLGSRLPTHAENLDSPGRPSAPFPIRRTTRESNVSLSRSASSSDNEPIVVMDHAPTPTPGSMAGLGFGSGVVGGGGAGGFGSWKMPSKATGAGGAGAVGGSGGNRRESISAEKALREVEKALAGVEAR